MIDRISAHIKIEMNGRGLRECASEIGISHATLSRVLKGRLPNIVTFKKICEWTKINSSYFLDLKEDNSVRKIARYELIDKLYNM